MEPKFQVQLKIQKPASEVFDAVVNPKKLSGYFVQSASGPLVEGTTVQWRFAEVPGDTDVIVRQVVRDERIVFEWPAEGGYNTRVEMLFEPLDAGNTMVRIRESGWRQDAQGFKSSYDNAGGWMHMMACLKAFLEYGINLRAGGAL
ncbi:MAG: ATPase [Myxococcaceae bacterium]|nr:MAG: ATPase [Myxococcaceae bacterium]